MEIHLIQNLLLWINRSLLHQQIKSYQFHCNVGSSKICCYLLILTEYSASDIVVSYQPSARVFPSIIFFSIINMRWRTIINSKHYYILTKPTTIWQWKKFHVHQWTYLNKKTYQDEDFLFILTAPNKEFPMAKSLQSSWSIS